MDEIVDLYVLLAPVGQLTGNGQLRETISERRNRKGEDVNFWYLPPHLVKEFHLADLSLEAVVAEDPTAIDWLRLRFGGDVQTIKLNISKLRELAKDLPAPPTVRDIGV